MQAKQSKAKVASYQGKCIISMYFHKIPNSTNYLSQYAFEAATATMLNLWGERHKSHELKI